MSSPHILILSSPYVGHSRPLCNLACNLQSLSPSLHVTFVYHVAHASLIDSEIARHAAGSSEKHPMEVMDRLHMRPVGSNIEGGVVDNVSKMSICVGEEINAFGPLYEELFKSETIPPPTVFILDVMCAPIVSTKIQVDSTLSLKKHIPAILFCPFPASYITEFLRVYVNPPYSAEDAEHPLRKKVGELWPALKDIRTQHEVYEEICNIPDCPPLEVVGTPDMYPWERLPHRPMYCLPTDNLDVFFGIAFVFANLAKDGLLLNMEGEMDVEGMKVLEDKLSAPIYTVGPQFNEAFWSENLTSSGTELSKGPSFDQFSCWLDAQANKSVLYISFGTATIPKTTSHYVALFDTILSQTPPLPFIFSRDPAQIKLPDALEERLNARVAEGGALISQWCPQHLILKHKATSFFLSHGGSGSMNESIVCGVPLILWPVAYDQPYLSAVLSITYDVGFELVQIRDGISIGKHIARGGVVYGTDEAIRLEMAKVFLAMRSSQGEQKRANMQRLKEMFEKSKNAGRSKAMMERLLKL